jgi:glycosyltransferase involved in cell wall biosynthesis
MSATSGAHDLARDAPTVSVGMPAYNSAAWIESAIESILAQTFRGFELIISDNASTDETLALCEKYASVDSRIRLLRQPKNLGANRNYLAVLHAARGRYFKWASSNDLCAPTFIEKCVAALDGDDSAVLVCPRSYLFEQSLADAQPYERDLELTEDEPAARFITMHHAMGLNNAFNGLIRRDALERVSSMGSFMGADIVLMGELALLGKLLLIEDRLFYRRMSREAATKRKSARDVEMHLVPTARTPLKWQHWRYHLALLRATRLVRFASRDWFRAVNYALRSLVWARNSLAEDALRAIRLPTW